ncbi:hypothetical protein HZC31_04505 [Candidatus Woesearchaeota archaeon]|nr:hypothetical protein [Candidatus Woesearchaeota archaeon]
MGIEVLIWDFDGTATKVDEEAVNFVVGYKEGFAKAVNVSLRTLNPFWNIMERRVRENPTQHGWTVNGKIVAPAYADPLVECRTIGDFLLLEHGEYQHDPQKRDALLYKLFRENYPKCTIVFKEDAAAAFRASQDFTPTYVVTNSETDAVQGKINLLGTDVSRITVLGGAKKYVLDDEWIALPESLEEPGFGRPLYLRRKNYADILSRIMKEKGVAPEQVLVAGDIYELDLLLPQQLGMHIALLPRERTPAYERSAVTSYARGVVLATPSDVVRYARQVQ